MSNRLKSGSLNLDLGQTMVSATNLICLVPGYIHGILTCVSTQIQGEGPYSHNPWNLSVSCEISNDTLISEQQQQKNTTRSAHTDKPRRKEGRKEGDL